MTQATEFLTVDGRRLEVARHPGTDHDAPTLIFLHEGLGSVGLWKGFPQAVGQATGCPVLVYSRAGYGRSDPVPVPRPLTYMHHEGLVVLPELMDVAGIGDAILVGHSDGASIALVNAGGVRDPRVRGVVAMAPHVFNEDISVASIREARTAYETGGLRDRLARHHADVDCAFWGWNRAWLDPDFRHWTIEEFLPAIRIPLLLIQGREDEYGTAAQLDAIARQSGGPVETCWLTPCRHSPHKDRPDETLAAIAAFVARVRREVPAAAAQP
ncbi:alpha/beta fold hydrolase [Caenispirillum bisanense]|uniref:Pimeloyl-ACP methyl ester carboxylesterase n=1 Tax=Caenispirillum bisanense TaxID=414052 RepID=A0A286GL48_9PROT|nr:alpha/beta hydrolase [Caenispirillum bisanense]SOD96261.1 Pimeloyl-ACP methyl ester carboxylesterase [Caenispirillum bisanense]